MLEFKDVSYSLGQKSIIENLNLEVVPGERVALLGPNGAGKTTALKLAAGLKKPGTGQVLWEENSIAGSRPRTGYLGHEVHLYEDLTLRQNLKFFARLYGVERDSDDMIYWLKRLGLELYADDPASSLSRGLKQRLALCRCFFISPRLLLLDEPFTGLDLESAGVLIELLEEFSGLPVLYTTHDIDRALNHCQRWLLLVDGSLKASGSREEGDYLISRFPGISEGVRGS